MKRTIKNSKAGSAWPLGLGWALLVLTAYGRLLLDPTLHTACPENDTWNLPIRYSVLWSLQNGSLPLWNPLSAFGIPWLATWQTETFYPGTLFFKWFGLKFWNYSGVLHLLILSVGVYRLLRASGVQTFWAFFSAAIALLNGCAYNHLGSNSSMDTMAWMPWVLLAAKGILDQKPWAGLQFAAFVTLQIFAGYPQIIFYTLIGCAAYAVFLKRAPSLLLFAAPFGGALLLSACQWLPSVEYFFLHCVRLPAVANNPHFFLPLENLKTFLSFTALSKDGLPDYVASPTFFYFNLYSGIVPLLILAAGLIRFDRLGSQSRFFLLGFLALLLWSLGFFLKGFELLHIPFPAFFEPAKCWPVLNLFELAAIGLLLQDLFPKPKKWKWAVLAAAVLNLLIPVLRHPLERNLTPPDPQLEVEAGKLTTHLASGRVLILPNDAQHAALYTPLPGQENQPLFKRFAPNSNLYARIPSANFYGSTWPTQGAMNAVRYFQFGFPYSSGSLMDLLGVDLLYLPETAMPSRFTKLRTDGPWGLWKNRSSLGSHFLFTGRTRTATRREAFESFAAGTADPLRDLFLGTSPVSPAPQRNLAVLERPAGALDLSFKKNGFLVVTQNALPGWRAWVDGIPSDMHLADGIFQCVPISKGAGWVKLSYEPSSFRFGLFLSLLACGSLIVCFGFRCFRRTDS